MSPHVTRRQLCLLGRQEIPVRIYRPGGNAAKRSGMVFFPGGGFVTPGLKSHDGFVRALAAATGHAVVSVASRLAPRHPFPAAVLDACDVTAHMAGHGEDYGIDADYLAVAGTGAGGNLAAVVAQQPQGTELMLRHQVLIVPPTDPYARTPSLAQFARSQGLDGDKLDEQTRQYLGPAEQDDLRAAPLRAEDLTGLPPGPW